MAVAVHDSISGCAGRVRSGQWSSCSSCGSCTCWSTRPRGGCAFFLPGASQNSWRCWISEYLRAGTEFHVLIVSCVSFSSASFCVGFSILLIADLKLKWLRDHVFWRNSASRIHPRSNGCKPTALSPSHGISAWDLKLSRCMNVCMSRNVFDCNYCMCMSMFSASSNI